jgi:cytidine deaminase
VCAERNAVAAAVLGGASAIDGIAIATETSPPSAPCGGCRQVLREFAPDPARLEVIAVNPRGERRRWTLAELLPDGFSNGELPLHGSR